jgi:aryl-alcohol dehydrogenase-like predicted oxidoreductase
MTAALPRRGRIVLGAMNFGTTVADDTAFALLDAYVDAGGAWIDTANCYAFWNDPSGVGGQSEELIGRWLAARPGVRDRVRIATKVRQQPLVPHRWPESAEGLSAAAIADAVPASLRRLGVDHVDLLWAHAEDRTVPLEETVAAFGEVVAQGVARRLGASNHAARRVGRARGIARDQGVEGWSALQLRRSYVEPRPGAPLPDAGHRLMSPDDLDYAAAEDLEVWAYTPLLNGGYVRADRPFPQAYDHPGTARRLAALDAVADELGATRNQVVLAWLLGGRPAISPIVGVSGAAQLTEAMAAEEIVLTGAQRERLDAAT